MYGIYTILPTRKKIYISKAEAQGSRHLITGYSLEESEAKTFKTRAEASEFLGTIRNLTDKIFKIDRLN